MAKRKRVKPTSEARASKKADADESSPLYISLRRLVKGDKVVTKEVVAGEVRIDFVGKRPIGVEILTKGRRVMFEYHEVENVKGATIKWRHSARPTGGD